MKTLLSSIALAVLFTACSKTASIEENLVGSQTTSAQNQNSPNIAGYYSGTFHRTGMDTVGVMLDLPDQKNYSGYSVRPKYPAICSGTYSNTSSTITFNDTCNWTADFDWTLILKGTYNLQIGDKTLRIWRTTGNMTDEYLLRIRER